MMFRSILVVTALSATSSAAFQATSPSPMRRQTASLHLNSNSNSNNADNSSVKSSKNAFASLALAGSIFASALGLATPFAATPAPAANAVELSTGAIIIQTSGKEGQSLLKAEVDVKDLLVGILKNRKALTQSVGRVAAVVKEELKAPVWAELTKEVLQFEGDVLPEVTVLPPRDVSQTVSDISKAKLNLIVNGEIINLSVDAASTSSEDEIVIRAKGFKGEFLPGMNPSPTLAARTRVQEQIDTFNNFWYAPLQLPEALAKGLPAGTTVKTGDALLGSTVLVVGGAYGGSYTYYVNEQSAAAEKAEAQRQLVAERKKKAAANAAQKKADEDADSES